MGNQLRLYISEEGADAERVDTLTSYLRAELAELDVQDVAPAPAGVPPPGARAGVAATAGALLVGLGQSAQGLGQTLSVITAWLRRGAPATREVRLEIDGDVLELSQASLADQERLIEIFISRHRVPEG